MIRFLIAALLMAQAAVAGLPPTTSKDSADSSDLITFKYQFPNFTGTHTGTTFSLGVNSVSGGGTGLSNLTANNVILGNGTSNVQLVAPGTGGNVLTSNGTTWASAAPTSGVATSGYEPETFILNGGISVVDGIDGVRRAENNKTIQKIVVCDKANTTSDSVTVRVNYGASLASSTTVTLASGATGYGCTSTTPAISLSTNDLQTMDVTAASGAPENLSVRLIF